MLELRSLRHLVVLARRLNYVRSADELGITQPSLTRSIQALEQRLGIKLFDRDRGGVSLTPQGRMIAERAGFLLNDADDLERQARMYGLGESGRIHFGMAPLPAHALLRHVLTDSLNLSPTVTNEVAVRDVEALWGMLIGGEIEFFVSPNPPLHDLSPADVEVLGTFPLSLIVRAGHPILADAAAEQQFPLIRSSWTGVVVPEKMQPRILGRPSVIEDFATLAALTASTDAIWLSSAYAVQQEISSGTLVELLRAEHSIEMTLYSLHRRSRSPLAQTVIDRLRDCVRNLN